MLHGGPGLANSYTAYYQQPYLGFCNVVYYDQRGSGKTQIKNNPTPESLRMETLLEDLRQTVQRVKDKYQTDSVFLAAHSWGSMLGTQYVIKYPRTVAGYIGYGQVVDENTQSKIWYEHIKASVMKSGNPDDISAFKRCRVHTFGRGGI